MKFETKYDIGQTVYVLTDLKNTYLETPQARKISLIKVIYNGIPNASYQLDEKWGPEYDEEILCDEETAKKIWEILKSR